MDDRYVRFRNTPFVARLASTPKWTVSTNQKMPLDMYAFKYRHIISGALYSNEDSLTTLDEVNSLLPDAANYTYYLDALIDNIVVLDIEPKCPQEIKDKLLQMPCLYCETSMSGKGIHMVFPLPADILEQYPDAKAKIVFKEEHGYYEILLNHYVTFTANQLPHVTGTDAEPFRQLFLEMAQTQRVSSKADVTIEALQKVETQYSDLILSILMNHKKDYKKTLADFNGDHSKYEFAYMAFLNHRLTKMLDLPAMKADHNYTDSERAWFLYTVAVDYLPHRPKHDEQRNKMPWLLYLAGEVIAHNKKDDKKDGGDS